MVLIRLPYPLCLFIYLSTCPHNAFELFFDAFPLFFSLLTNATSNVNITVSVCNFICVLEFIFVLVLEYWFGFGEVIGMFYRGVKRSSYVGGGYK